MGLELMPLDEDVPKKESSRESEYEINLELSRVQKLIKEALENASPENLENPEFRLAANNMLTEKFHELDQLEKSDEEIKMVLKDELEKFSQF